MVDVGEKPATRRMARAEAWLEMAETTLQRVRQRDLAKGDVLEVARLAGIMAAKQTGGLIPLCHPLPIDSAEVRFECEPPNRLRIEATVAITARTGVEMEALTAVSVAALTVYDMCKAIDRGMTIRDVRLVEKRGGKSGVYLRDSEGRDA